jgi:hypothetical protein
MFFQEYIIKGGDLKVDKKMLKAIEKLLDKKLNSIKSNEI